MKNKLTDLNDALFCALERLNDESVTGKELEANIARAKAMTDVSKQIIDVHRVVIEATSIRIDFPRAEMPECLEFSHKK